MKIAWKQINGAGKLKMKNIEKTVRNDKLVDGWVKLVAPLIFKKPSCGRPVNFWSTSALGTNVNNKNQRTFVVKLMILYSVQKDHIHHIL